MSHILLRTLPALRAVPRVARVARVTSVARVARVAPAAPIYRAASTSPLLTTSLSHPPIPTSPRITVSPPSLAAIQADGYIDNPVLLPPEDAVLNITPEAVSQLALLASKEPADSTLALRVGVDSGGCHGFQYVMELTEERGNDDYIMTPEGTSVPVVVDLMSLGMLKGATLHYATELIGSSFRLQDNPQAKDGGNCGCGVSWEAKDMAI